MRLFAFLTALLLCLTTALHAQTEDRSTLSMQGGFFAPSFYINGKKTDREKFVSKINLTPFAKQQFRSGSTLKGVGNLFGLIGAIPFGAETGRRLAYALEDEDITNTSVNQLRFYGGGALFIVGTALFYTGRKQQKIAIKIHNTGSRTTSLHLVPTTNGIGLALTF